jgi:hypothetical protein
MKRLLTLMLGLGLAIGSVTATFAQEQKKEEGKKKKGKKKKGEEPKKETR